jgi:hypothetical protein
MRTMIASHEEGTRLTYSETIFYIQLLNTTRSNQDDLI